MNSTDVSPALSFNSLSFEGFSEMYGCMEIDYVMLLYGFHDYSRTFFDDVDEEEALMIHSEIRLLKLLLLHWRDLASRHPDIEHLTLEEYRFLYFESLEFSDNLWQFLHLEFIRLKSFIDQERLASPNQRPVMRSQSMERPEHAVLKTPNDVCRSHSFSDGISPTCSAPASEADNRRCPSNKDVRDSSNCPDPVAVRFVDFLSSIHDNLALFMLVNGPTSVPAEFREVFRTLIQVQCRSHKMFLALIMQMKRNNRAPQFEFEGVWTPDVECAVCFETLGAFVNRCCGTVICEHCFTRYINTQLAGLNRLHIECPASDCTKPVAFSSIWLRLSETNRIMYDKIRNNQNQTSTEKLCPNCMQFYELSGEERQLVLHRRNRKLHKKGLNVKCQICQFEWCFKCQTKVHPLVSCKKNMSIDKLLIKWANGPDEEVMQKARAKKARKCPNCHILVERNGGCPHMKCAKCKCSWCFDCGRRWRTFKHIPFMHHDSKYFIFGCSKNLLANHSHLRRFVRVSVFCGITVLVIPASAIAAVVLLALGVLLGLPFGVYILGHKVHKLSNSS